MNLEGGAALSTFARSNRFLQTQKKVKAMRFLLAILLALVPAACMAHDAAVFTRPTVIAAAPAPSDATAAEIQAAQTTTTTTTTTQAVPSVTVQSVPTATMLSVPSVVTYSVPVSVVSPSVVVMPTVIKPARFPALRNLLSGPNVVYVPKARVMRSCVGVSSCAVPARF